MILFQVKLEQPDKMEIDLNKVAALEKLSCQEKQQFLDQKISQTIINLKKNTEPYINEKKTQDLEHLHFIVNVIRSMSSNKAEDLQAWAACISLISRAETPLMHIGFFLYTVNHSY